MAALERCKGARKRERERERVERGWWFNLMEPRDHETW